MTQSNSQHHAPSQPADSTRSAVLHHTLQDGSSHYDWMIEIPACHEEHRLLTFRTSTRPDRWDSGQLFPVEQLTNHRAAYLQFQGDIGQSRGSVTRMSSGWCSGLNDRSATSARIELSMIWDAEPEVRVVYVGERTKKNWWTFGSSRIGLASGGKF